MYVHEAFEFPVVITKVLKWIVADLSMLLNTLFLIGYTGKS